MPKDGLAVYPGLKWVRGTFLRRRRQKKQFGKKCRRGKTPTVPGKKSRYSFLLAVSLPLFHLCFPGKRSERVRRKRRRDGEKGGREASGINHTLKRRRRRNPPLLFPLLLRLLLVLRFPAKKGG